MNTPKTTAVDWLINEQMALTIKYLNEEFDSTRFDELRIEMYEQAREIFKEQIEQSYVEGCLDTYGCDKPDTNKTDEYFAEQYYNQTYGRTE